MRILNPIWKLPKEQSKLSIKGYQIGSISRHQNFIRTQRDLIDTRSMDSKHDSI